MPALNQFWTQQQKDNHISSLQSQINYLNGQLAQAQAMQPIQPAQPQQQMMLPPQSQNMVASQPSNQSVGGGLNTQIVEDFSQISVNSIPMNDNGALFVKKDGSEIQSRRWTAEGTISITSYLPVVQRNGDEANNSTPSGGELKLGLSDDVTQALLNEFQNISARFDKLEQTISPTKTTQKSAARSKKEADSE